MIAWLFSLLLSALNPTPATPASTPDKDKVTQPAPGDKGGDEKTIILEDIYIG